MLLKLSEEVWLTVISARRPENVGPMTELLQWPATWYVPPDDVVAYAEQCEFHGGTALGVLGLSGARNAALDDAFNQTYTCVQFDDDLKSVKQLHNGKAYDIAPQDALEEMENRLYLSDYKLCGVAPTNNAYFASKSNSDNLFVIGSMMMIEPSEPRFDTTMKLKEDYAFTADHILTYGGVLRCNDIIPDFKHYTNKGGAVDVRNDEVEAEMCRYLVKRYPGMIRLNSKRKNEVLLKAPRKKRIDL